MFILTCSEALGGFEELSEVAQLTSTLITIIKIAVPLLLIVWGMLDLGKAVVAQKEDEIKKGQQIFIKRIIAAVLVFLVVFVVQLVFGLVANTNDSAKISSCIDCFINNKNC